MSKFWDQVEAMLAEEDDAFVDFGYHGGGARYDVSLAGKHVGTRGDMDAAVSLLAVEMTNGAFWPNVWYVNERGNTTLVEILDFDSGTYRFTDTSYV